MTPGLPKHPEVGRVPDREGDRACQRGDQVRHRHVQDEAVYGVAEQDTVFSQDDDDGQVPDHGHEHDYRGVGPSQRHFPLLRVRDVRSVRKVVVAKTDNIPG